MWYKNMLTKGMAMTAFVDGQRLEPSAQQQNTAIAIIKGVQMNEW
jgi:hypothetical protein